MKRRANAVSEQKITRYDINSKGTASGKTVSALEAYQQAKVAGKTAVIVAKDEDAKVRICINHNVDPRDVVLQSDLINDGRLAN